MLRIHIFVNLISDYFACTDPDPDQTHSQIRIQQKILYQNMLPCFDPDPTKHVQPEYAALF